jgi:hypothetical protein
VKHTLIKWLVGICVVSWAAKNPGPVGADIHTAMGAGVSVVNSVMSSAGSAISGVSGGLAGGTQAPAVPAVPATGGH